MLLISQILHQFKLFARRPAAFFFVVIMPLVLLGVFTQVFGNEPIKGMTFSTAQFYAPGLAVFGLVTACYTYLAISTATARDIGILKRIRGTPLPPWIYIAGRIAATALIGIIAAVLVMGVGVLFLGVEIYPERLAGAVLVMVVGSLTFSALGIMICALCRTSETTQAVSNATLLPLAFVSDIFIRPSEKTPEWIKLVGDLFPLKHLAAGFGGAFKPGLVGNGFVWSGTLKNYIMLPDLVVIAAWGLFATIIAVKYFAWEPGGERG